jgi:hypothetical protein
VKKLVRKSQRCAKSWAEGKERENTIKNANQKTNEIKKLLNEKGMVTKEMIKKVKDTNE